MAGNGLESRWLDAPGMNAAEAGTIAAARAAGHLFCQTRRHRFPPERHAWATQALSRLVRYGVPRLVVAAHSGHLHTLV